jgi:hypothetical protein
MFIVPWLRSMTEWSCRLFLVVIIALPVATPKEFRNSAAFAFGRFINSAHISGYIIIFPHAISASGWGNGFAFILSFLAPAWTIGPSAILPLY